MDIAKAVELHQGGKTAFKKDEQGVFFLKPTYDPETGEKLADVREAVRPLAECIDIRDRTQADLDRINYVIANHPDNK